MIEGPGSFEVVSAASRDTVWSSKPGPVAPHGPGWTRFPISCVDDLSDAVYGADLAVTQLSRNPVTGSLAFTIEDGLLCSSGLIEERVALRGPLSSSMVTLGIALHIGPGSRHWLNEVFTGNIGVFLPGGEHDALYTGGSLYATVTLSAEHLEEHAARTGVVLDLRTLGGTGISSRRVDLQTVARLRRQFDGIHGQLSGALPGTASIGRCLLDVAISHFGRVPSPRLGCTDPLGIARVVARAREFIHARLDAPLSIDAIAAAAHTSRRTLQRAFHDVLGESVQEYVLTLRLHRIRHDLASDAEAACTVALVANRWGISELGRLSRRYRSFFGELPSQTLRSAMHSSAHRAR